MYRYIPRMLFADNNTLQFELHRAQKTVTEARKHGKQDNCKLPSILCFERSFLTITVSCIFNIKKRQTTWCFSMCLPYLTASLSQRFSLSFSWLPELWRSEESCRSAGHPARLPGRFHFHPGCHRKHGPRHCVHWDQISLPPDQRTPHPFPQSPG